MSTFDAQASDGGAAAETARQAVLDAASTYAYAVIDNQQCFDASSVAQAHTMLDEVRRKR